MEAVLIWFSRESPLLDSVVAGFRQSNVSRIPAEDEQPLKGKTHSLIERCYPRVSHGSLVAFFIHFLQVSFKKILSNRSVILTKFNINVWNVYLLIWSCRPRRSHVSFAYMWSLKAERSFEIFPHLRENSTPRFLNNRQIVVIQLSVDFYLLSVPSRIFRRSRHVSESGVRMWSFLTEVILVLDIF